MSEKTKEVGDHIRKRRKECGLTIQQLADRIHKSRASVSKYETGEITLDIEPLYEISEVLDIEASRLLADSRPQPPVYTMSSGMVSESPFFQAKRLYFYFFDGRYGRMKDGIIDIHKSENAANGHEASLSIRAVTKTGRSSEIYYTGKVVYSDMLIRFSFVNQYNALEEDLLYIFNPLELRDYTEGLLCGISSADLMPCAFKCLVTLTPQIPDESLKQHLLFTAKELRRWKKLNMLIVDNRAT